MVVDLAKYKDGDVLPYVVGEEVTYVGTTAPGGLPTVLRKRLGDDEVVIRRGIFQTIIKKSNLNLNENGEK